MGSIRSNIYKVAWGVPRVYIVLEGSWISLHMMIYESTIAIKEPEYSDSRTLFTYMALSFVRQKPWVIHTHVTHYT